MQDLKNFMVEKLDISKEYSGYNYQPKTKNELQDLLDQLTEERGFEGDFNDIDTSLITDMSYLFAECEPFNGDISKWNTSKVTNMSYMFFNAFTFNQNISRWDTSKVTDMQWMFYGATSFNQNISRWKVSNVRHTTYMFELCHIKNYYKPHFK